MRNFFNFSEGKNCRHSVTTHFLNTAATVLISSLRLAQNLSGKPLILVPNYTSVHIKTCNKTLTNIIWLSNLFRLVFYVFQLATNVWNREMIITRQLAFLHNNSIVKKFNVMFVPLNYSLKLYKQTYHAVICKRGTGCFKENENNNPEH